LSYEEKTEGNSLKSYKNVF